MPALSAYREPPEYRPELSKSRGVTVSNHGDKDGIGADSLFKDAIQRDPSLCNNCFSERFDYISIQWKCGSQGWMNYSRRYPVPGRNSPDPNRQLRSDGGPLCCAECGHHTGKDRALSHRVATAHAGRISDALARRGIEHDRRVLLAHTVERNKIPDSTGVEDVQVFPQAVSKAVRVVQ